MSQLYRAAKMLGRLVNGNEADRGSLVHAVRRKDVPSPRIPDIWITIEIALCGARPGRRSVGWTGALVGEKGYTVDCPRCVSKLEKEST